MKIKTFSIPTAFSVDPEGLYGEGGFFEGSIAQLRKAPAIEIIRERAGYEYTRAQPEVSVSAEFREKLLTHYREIDKIFRRGSGTVTSLLENVVLSSNCIFIEEESELLPLYDTYQPYDRLAVQLPDDSALACLEQMKCSETFVHLGSSGSANYGHWLVDDLPRLRLPRVEDGVTVYLLPLYSDEVNEKKRQFLERLLADAEAPWELRFIDPLKPLRIPRLRFTSLPTYHPIMKDPRAMAWLRTVVGPAMTGGSTGQAQSERIFVSRGSGHGRALTNEAAIAAQLAARGFIFVNAQAMSAAEQISVFANAKIIIGAMGAAMTNTVFSPRGAQVLHLAPEGWIEPFYWDLAATTGQDYAAVYGAAKVGVEPSWADYEIGFRELGKHLERMGV